VRTIRGRMQRWAASSGRLHAARVLVRESPSLAALLVLLTVGGVATSTAARVLLGLTVGEVPDVVGQGLGSDAGERTLALFVAAGACYAVSLLVPPVEDMLATNVKARLTAGMQQRLMRVVSRPAGVSHIDDPAMQDKLALAQGSLMTYMPADAPIAMARSARIRLNGFVACCILAWFHWWLGLGVFVFWRLVRRPLRQSLLDMVATFGGEADVMRRAFYFQSLTTTPAAAKETRVFGLGGWTVDRFREHWLLGMEATWKHTAAMNRVVLRVGLLVLAINLLICGLAADAALDGDLSLAALAIILTSLVVVPFSGSIHYDDVTIEWMTAALPHFDEIDAQLGAQEPADRLPPSRGMPQHAIEFRDVAFAYPGRAATPVYAHLDIEIRAGRSTAIVGANGAGKTTLVKLLAALHEPDAGCILVDGTPLDTLDARAWQRHVAVVFQDFARFPLSARENIALGAIEHQDDEAGIVEAAQAAGLTGVIEGLPLGFDTVLSRSYDGGVDLSGGQWQRIALARALFAARHGATVLVLDEPTSQMDIRAEASFYERFLEITRGLTTVVISHRFATVRLADDICVVDGGRVVERGDHDELLRAGGLYARMFRMQAARFEHDSPEGDPEPEAA
jgi:ATP-binding cassette, subfamily B, bacterial